MNGALRVCAMAAGITLAMTVSAASPSSPQDAQREIDALIAGLGESGCEFERNGSWYDAQTASGHLQKKYDYLRKRDMARTAEQFIARGASKSSMSGQAYRVRCPGKPVDTSEHWFRQRLQALRTAPVR